ncbi:MAG: flavin reductase family protein [Meiothermus sp.]|uniref:flavin reductase family protein n=1 Tax=Meiothermus sp. TaxID=1955249 RepID=UPI00298F3A08|nr:flavin reductase family protein [Meiothermus sp.]MDW8090661.1 flavin reductase family protein [Meiothermus sp.]MDW8482583.1 flavin reductase family protein [Meiothermus sp.]
MRLALLAVGENFMPMAWWTPVSKEPFRFLLAMDRRNHTLSLLRELGEAALCFLPWEERAWVVRAGYLSGRRAQKAQKLGIPLRPARRLVRTQVPEKALAVYELRVVEWPTDGDHSLFLGDVLHAEGGAEAKRRPILFLGFRDFATLGETWRFRP